MKKPVIISMVILVLLIGAATISMANSDVFTANSDSIETLTQESKFTSHGFEVKELKDESKVSRDQAVEIAEKIVGAETSKEAQKITAVRALFTDNQAPQLPESSIILKDYPVWIVTFNGVYLEKNGLQTRNQNQLNEKVFAVENVVIDANTGEELETISYNK